MSSTNLFTVLDPENQPPKQEVKHQEPPKHEEPVKHQDPPKHHDVPHEKEHKNPVKPVNDEELKAEKEPVVYQKHPHEGVKQKGVSAEPHPLDRKSGTGRGKEVSKGGAGRHAWGTVEDELKRGDDVEDVEEENYEEKPVLPENLITLEEYKHKIGSDVKDPKVHEPPVLGTHSDSLGFKTEEVGKNIEKKEETHHEQVNIDEKNFPKLG